MADLILIVSVISGSCIAAIFAGIAIVKQIEKEDLKKKSGQQL